MAILGQTLVIFLLVFIGFLWIRFVVDWVQVFARQWEPRGPLLVALEGVYTVTDPPLKALRRVIPPLRVGRVSIDLSFIVLFFVVQILMRVVGEFR